MTKALKTLNILVVLIVLGWAGHTYLGPVVAEKLYGSEYKKLMFKCDLVMREHFIAKQLVKQTPTLETIQNLEAAEVGLTACHDYDKKRKQLQLWGMSDYQLSLIGLEAIEEKASDIRKFVEIHEIRY